MGLSGHVPVLCEVPLAYGQIPVFHSTLSPKGLTGQICAVIV